jgi:hypothetical protein
MGFKLLVQKMLGFLSHRSIFIRLLGLVLVSFSMPYLFFGIPIVLSLVVLIALRFCSLIPSEILAERVHTVLRIWLFLPMAIGSLSILWGLNSALSQPSDRVTDETSNQKAKE